VSILLIGVSSASGPSASLPVDRRQHYGVFHIFGLVTSASLREGNQRGNPGAWLPRRILYIPQVRLPLGCLPVTAHVTLCPAKKESVVYAGLPRPTCAQSTLWTCSNMHIEHNFQLHLRVCSFEHVPWP
jgi:hypothetical protein